MTNVLLDTVVVVRLLLGDRSAVSDAAREVIDDPHTVLLTSSASVWEIAIKRSLGRLRIAPTWLATLASLDLEPLPITWTHAQAVERLPWVHRDPFDRLIVAQAGVERCPVVSPDQALYGYGVEVIW